VTIRTILLVVALILFVLAAFGVGFGDVNLIAIGLATWVLAELLGDVRLDSRG
jgi:hypothetical protein